MTCLKELFEIWPAPNLRHHCSVENFGGICAQGYVCEQHLTYHLLMKCFWIAGGALSDNSCTLKFLTYMYINPKWTWTCFDYPCSTSFCCSVTKLCPTRYNPVGYSMPGSPVLHYLPELAHTHVHWFGDVIQPSHPLSSPSPPAFKLSQHQVFFPLNQFFSSRGQSTGVSTSAGIIPTDIQDWFPLWWTG